MRILKDLRASLGYVFVLLALSPCALFAGAAQVPSSLRKTRELRAITTDLLLTKVTKLTASDAATGDFFGASVALSGDTAVIGANGDDDNGNASGSAYIVERDGSGWGQFPKLTPSDGAAGDQFGTSVAISGDTVVVGSPSHSDSATSTGAAYVFVRSGFAWSQQQKLTASDAAEFDIFGISVAVSGDTAVVGAFLKDDAGNHSGAAYVFVRSGGVWSQQQKLTASDAAEEDEFGFSVAVTGDTVLVGSRGHSDAGTSSGAAYVFVRSGGVWSQQQKLTASDAAARDQFGISVGLSGDTAVVGAFLKDDAGSDSGAAYVFMRSGSVWSQQQKLTASDGAAGDQFGTSVAISGDTVAVGSPGDSDAGRFSGSAYVFLRNGGIWNQQQKLTANDPAALDVFGISVAVGVDTAVIGASRKDGAGVDSGAAYAYETSPGLTALSPANVWVGVKNNDDVGTRFDLKVEVLKNGSVVGSGGLNNVSGGSSGFERAILNAVPLSLFSPASLSSGDTLSVRLSVRASTVGHRSGTARLWFNDSAANSQFGATIDGLPVSLYLQNGFVLGSDPGPGPRKSVDVFVDRLVGGNPFKPFGTWSKTF